MLTVALGAVTAGLVLAQAWLIANTISDVVVHHQHIAHVRMLVVFLALVILGRSLVATQKIDHPTASAVKRVAPAVIEKFGF